MRSIRLDISVFQKLGGVEVEVQTYDEDRQESWKTEQVWQYQLGHPVMLGEAESLWESLADTLLGSVGCQLALPFE